MTVRNRGLAVAALVLSSSCGTASAPQPQTGCASAAVAVSSATDYLIARDNARDLSGVVAGYTDDVVWLPPTGAPVTGKAAIEARYRELFSTYQPHMRSETIDAAASGLLGFVRGTTSGTLVPIGGGEPKDVHDKFLAIVKCDGGVWRVSHLSWSPQSPGS
jgi:ketosteroid isomerase-like protein